MLERLVAAFDKITALVPSAVVFSAFDPDDHLRPALHTLSGTTVILVARFDGQRAGVALPGSELHFATPRFRHGPAPTPQFEAIVKNAVKVPKPRRPKDQLLVWLNTGSEMVLQRSATCNHADFLAAISRWLPPSLASGAGAKGKVKAVLNRLRRRVWSVELLVDVLAGPDARLARLPGDRVLLQGVNLNLPLPRHLVKRAREHGSVLRRGTIECSVEAIALAAAPALADFVELWVAGTARADLRSVAPVNRRLSGTEHTAPGGLRQGGVTPVSVVETVGQLAAHLQLSKDRASSLAARVESQFRSAVVYPSYGCQSEKRDNPSGTDGALCMQCPYAPQQRFFTCGGLGSTPPDVAVTLLRILAQERGRMPSLFEVLPACITAPPKNNTNNVYREEVSRTLRKLYEAMLSMSSAA